MFYVSYKCCKCSKETILISSEVQDSQFRRKYIVCAHCSSRKLRKERETDDLREIMSERSYKRVGRAVRQVRFNE